LAGLSLHRKREIKRKKETEREREGRERRKGGEERGEGSGDEENPQDDQFRIRQQSRLSLGLRFGRGEGTEGKGAETRRILKTINVGFASNLDPC